MKIKNVSKTKALNNKKLGGKTIGFELILMLIPGLILLGIFNYAPMYGILIAFKDFKILDGVMGSAWVGLDNFKDIIMNEEFVRVFKNTLVISALNLLFGFPTPIILAILLNEIRCKAYKKSVQTLTYLPHFFSWVVLAGIFKLLFSTTGPVNAILAVFGVEEPLSFFGDKTLFLIMLIVTSVWQGAGWGAVIYLSAISGIDVSLYEAGEIDGTNRFQAIRYITLPAIIPTITTVLIMKLGTILNVGYDQIYNMYNPMVYEVADVIDTYVLRRLQSLDYVTGTTVGLFKSVICLILVMTTNAITRKLSQGEQGIM